MEKGEIRFEQVLRLLPEGWEAKAKELGALQRAREIKTPEELLRLILLYLTEGKSFAGTSAITLLAGGATLNKMAVYKRIRNSAAWLQWLCENICRQAGFTVGKPAWLKNKNVILVDGTEDVKCGVRCRCYMLHYSLDLFTLAAREFLITDIHTGEKLSNFKRLGKGDIVIGDRAYGNLPGIAYARQQQADYLLRIQGFRHAFFDTGKRRIDLLERLSVLKEGETADISAQCVVNGRYEPVRICAMRKDTGGENKGLKRLTKVNQRKKGGKPVSERQRENNKYIIMATSLGKEVSAAQILELYRARWQIEIAFKRLKSLFAYNDLPANQGESVRAWFYGKLLLAALCEALVNTGRFSPPGETMPQIRFATS
jgi:hypothetical protein